MSPADYIKPPILRLTHQRYPPASVNIAPINHSAAFTGSGTAVMPMEKLLSVEVSPGLKSAKKIVHAPLASVVLKVARLSCAV